MPSTRHYIDTLDLHGDVLEIGGHRLSNCAIGLFEEPRFRYHDLNLVASDIPNTIIADITGCADVIPDASFDVVFSSDVFEHIDRPWLAAQEIARILRPGGIAITHTLFSWRNHPCPIDYWRYSAECLEFLFADLTCLEKGYDLSQRRVDQPGFLAVRRGLGTAGPPRRLARALECVLRVVQGNRGHRAAVQGQ